MEVSEDAVAQLEKSLDALTSAGVAEPSEGGAEVLRMAILRDGESFDRVELSFSAYDAQNYLYELMGEKRQAARAKVEKAEPEKAAKERGIQIYYTKIPTFIKGNVTLVSELVYNLLDNAIKYNKDNGKITVFVGESAKGVELSVKDTGIGIPPEDTERIFERFYRVDKSHSKKVGGTGLGLSIVKHVCACHNATIRVKSKVGKGTTIYVTFPNNVNN